MRGLNFEVAPVGEIREQITDREGSKADAVSFKRDTARIPALFCQTFSRLFNI